MAETVPTPITLPYAQSQLADCLAKLEDARVASHVSGQGNSWSPQSIASLQSERDYWARTVSRLMARASAAKNPAYAVATWT